MDFRLLKAKAGEHFQITNHPAKAGCKKAGCKKAGCKKAGCKKAGCKKGRCKKGRCKRLKEGYKKEMRELIKYET